MTTNDSLGHNRRFIEALSKRYREHAAFNRYVLIRVLKNRDHKVDSYWAAKSFGEALAVAMAEKGLDEKIAEVISIDCETGERFVW